MTMEDVRVSGALPQVWLQPAVAWLEALQAMQRAQMSITRLLLERLQAVSQVPARYDAGDVLAIPVELAQFGGAASLRLAQELADIGMHAAGEMNSRIIDAALMSPPALVPAAGPRA